MTGARNKTSWTLLELAQALGVKYQGDAAVEISGLATLAHAKPGQISFLANSLYRAQLQTTQASAVILDQQMAESCTLPALIAEQPYLLYAKLSHYFDRRKRQATGIHPSTLVAADAVIGEGCKIGPNVVIESGVCLGSGVEIGPGTVIGADCHIGDDCVIYANVTLYHRITIGQRCTLHSGVVIGADGFGFANEQGSWVKIAQLGGVTIGSDVDIGANTTIDRGALQDTLIGSGVILDNQIQIAHNVEIGEGTAIAGCTGIAGSTKIGKYCTIAGAVGIAGHLTITDRVHITMRSAITRNITASGSYSSGTAMSVTSQWRKNAARFRKLDEMARKIIELEKKLRRLGSKDE